jgi:hypothetical protein
MAAPVTEDCFPPSVIAAENYRRDLGAVLRSEASFGRDPFRSHNNRQACETQFARETPPLNLLLSRATHRDYKPLQDAVLRLVDLTCRFSQ